jgi:hypothetical protein
LFAFLLAAPARFGGVIPAITVMEDALKAKRMVASKPAAKKNEALGIIFTHPSKEWQAESPVLYLSNIITMR